jgi:hypothetical protein
MREQQPPSPKHALTRVLITTAVSTLIIAGAARAQSLPSLQAQTAQLEGSVRSIESVRSTTVRFENVSLIPVQIFWLNYEGKRVLYNTLAPGQSYVQGTFVTHPWLVAMTNGVALVIYEPTSQAGAARIKGDTKPDPMLPIQTPSLEADIRSRDGAPSVIVFRNVGPETVQLFWLDHAGRRVHFRTLLTGDGYQQATYVGHPWLVTDHMGRALGIFEPTTSGGVAEFAFDRRP